MPRRLWINEDIHVGVDKLRRVEDGVYVGSATTIVELKEEDGTTISGPLSMTRDINYPGRYRGYVDQQHTNSLTPGDQYCLWFTVSFGQSTSVTRRKLAAAYRDIDEGTTEDQRAVSWWLTAPKRLWIKEDLTFVAHDVRRRVDNVYLSDATVTLELKTSDGAAVSGPLSMMRDMRYPATYVGHLDQQHSNSLQPGVTYHMLYRVTSDSIDTTVRQPMTAAYRAES